MCISGVLLGIPFIISRNRQNVAPCSGLVKKSAFISPVRQYFSDKSPLPIQYFIKRYRTQMCFVLFILEYLQLFSMSIALRLSWWNLSSFAAYPCPSINYIDHRHCGKSSCAPNISASVDLLPYFFASVIDPLSIDQVRPLQSRCAAKDASTQHLMALRLFTLSMIAICRVPLMCLSTLTSFL